MWLTTADETQKLAPQPILAPVGPTTGDEAIAIDPAQHFQQMHGFGAAMTDASAELFSRLSDDKRRAIMAELFGRANGGLGLSFTRLTVGASDFSRTHYSYDDTPGNAPDPELQHFSIDPAKQYVLPRVREALAINPDAQGDDQPVERAGVDEDHAQPDPGPAASAILSGLRQLSRPHRRRVSSAKACPCRC